MIINIIDYYKFITLLIIMIINKDYFFYHGALQNGVAGLLDYYFLIIMIINIIDYYDY